MQRKVHYSEVIPKRGDGRWRLTIILEEEAVAQGAAMASPAFEVLADSDLSSRLTLTIAEAAKMLGIGRTTLYALIAGGELPSVSIGRKRLIRREALERFLAQRESGGYGR